MSSDFCKLGSDLIISYNGSFLECVPNRSSLVGTVLTRSGQLISRTNQKSDWELFSTPSVYLFYDNDTNITFLVDTCKHVIKEIQPEGRILDCTDRIIYEIKCNNWVPICDLSNKINKIIVLCDTVPATATTATFQFMGKNPIVECFSEISADQVVFFDHSATVTFNASGPGSLPIGGCTILAFTVCIDNETITIFKIFIRQAARSQVAAECANLDSLLTLPVQENTFCDKTTFVATPITTSCPNDTTSSIVAGISLTGVLTPISLPVPLTGTILPAAINGAPTPAAISGIVAGNVTDVTGWKTRFITGFNLINNDGFQPTIPGNYNINAVISYASDTVIPSSLFSLQSDMPLPLGTTISINGGPPIVTDPSTNILFNGIIPPRTLTVPIPRTTAPRFVLLRGTTTSGGVIEADAPLSANIFNAGVMILSFNTGVTATLPPALNLNEVGQAVISVGLTLTPNDVLRVAFVDQPGTLTITLPAGFFLNLPGAPSSCTPVTLVIPIPPPFSFNASPPVASFLTPLDPVGTTFNATLIG